MSNEQPEALRLAESLKQLVPLIETVNVQAAAELRHLHSLNRELVEALEHSVTVLEKMNCTAYTARAALAKAKGESNE